MSRAPGLSLSLNPFSHSQAVLAMVGVTAMWSIAGVVTRQLEHARSFEVTFWRSLFTALALAVFLLPGRSSGMASRIRAGGMSLWISGFCWSVMFTAFMVALTLTSVANVLVVMAAGPLVTALVARVTVGQRLARRTWWAIAVAGLGIAWMYGPQLASGNWTGSLVAMCVPLAAGVNWTVVHRSQGSGHEVDLMPAVLVGAVLSTLATLPLALPFSATPHDIGWLALLGLVQLAVPCLLAVRCARVLHAPEIALLALLEVIFGIALAWLIVGEEPGTTVLAGGALVIGALLANELPRLRRPG
ncbi:DMT family transporter [Xylophilus sp. GW821-FHT01B05]